MTNLIKTVFCILFLLAFSFKSFGQRLVPVPVGGRVSINRANRTQLRKVEHVKELYIGSRLKLTSEESKEFWPVYRQYVQDQTAVKILKRINNSKSSANGTGQIDRELQYETELVNIRKHYRDEFLKILPPEKVSELYKSEHEFNDEVVKQLSERSIRAGN